MATSQKRNNKTTQSLSGQLISPFVSIQKEFDKALHGFYDMFESRPSHLHEFENLCLAPLMDLVEDGNCYKLEVEMPGLDEKDIHVSINGNLLTVCGEKSTSRKDARKNYIAREIHYGRYERSITLPQSADGDKATASFKKGMLWITIPKRTGSKGQAHEIEIEKM